MSLEGTALFLVALYYLINGLLNKSWHLQIRFTEGFPWRLQRLPSVGYFKALYAAGYNEMCHVVLAAWNTIKSALWKETSRK